jgi:hypothetical protein
VDASELDEAEETKSKFPVTLSNCEGNAVCLIRIEVERWRSVIDLRAGSPVTLTGKQSQSLASVSNFNSETSEVK